MTALDVLWHTALHIGDVVWHAIVIGWAVAYPIWLASVAYNVVCERLQRRRDRRARLAAQLRDDVRTARARELPKAVIDEHLAVLDLALFELEFEPQLRDPRLLDGA